MPGLEGVRCGVKHGRLSELLQELSADGTVGHLHSSKGCPSEPLKVGRAGPGARYPVEDVEATRRCADGDFTAVTDPEMPLEASKSRTRPRCDRYVATHGDVSYVCTGRHTKGAGSFQADLAFDPGE